MPEQHDGTPKSDSDRLVRIETLVEGLAAEDTDHERRIHALESIATRLDTLLDTYKVEIPSIKERLSRTEKLTYVGLGMAILIAAVLVPLAAGMLGG